MTPILDHAWLFVECNICCLFTTWESLLVCVDYCSHFPEGEIVRKTTASVATSKLGKPFWRCDAPAETIIDNEL